MVPAVQHAQVNSVPAEVYPSCIPIRCRTIDCYNSPISNDRCGNRLRGSNGD